MTNITFFVTIKILNSQFAVKAATLDAYIILEMQLKLNLYILVVTQNTASVPWMV